MSEDFGNNLVEKDSYDAVMPDAWRWTRVDDSSTYQLRVQPKTTLLLFTSYSC